LGGGRQNHVAWVERDRVRQFRHDQCAANQRTDRNLRPGGRGFNVYTGTVKAAEFERIITHADGAVGIQISQPVGRIKVRRGVETFGGTGDSLVKGAVVKLSAIALSVKPGGSVRKVDVAGGLITHGAGVNPLELQGAIECLRIADGFTVAGASTQFEPPTQNH
jgi:hypothetical protein